MFAERTESFQVCPIKVTLGYGAVDITSEIRLSVPDESSMSLTNLNSTRPTTIHVRGREKLGAKLLFEITPQKEITVVGPIPLTKVEWVTTIAPEWTINRMVGRGWGVLSTKWFTSDNLSSPFSSATSNFLRDTRQLAHKQNAIRAQHIVRNIKQDTILCFKHTRSVMLIWATKENCGEDILDRIRSNEADSALLSYDAIQRTESHLRRVKEQLKKINRRAPARVLNRNELREVWSKSRLRAIGLGMYKQKA